MVMQLLPAPEDAEEWAMDVRPIRLEVHITPALYRRLQGEQSRRRCHGRPYSLRAIVVELITTHVSEDCS